MRRRTRRRGLAALLTASLLLGAVAYGALEPPRVRAGGPVLGDADFAIEPYVSTHDADGDGVDDQSDILESARSYVESRPVYESAYYEGGYPDDGRGVCTDVVAFALRGAGFDLRVLVDEDKRQSPAAYGGETPDPNIDFRRVRNLRVWFDRHARSLTLDPGDISAWAGGDIVCYEDHIAVVSDRRNKDGVPYLIHHWGRLQRHYEEDRLATYGTITGHWRLG